MPFVKPLEQIPADNLRGRVGKPNLFGWIVFGWSEFGDSDPDCGVYQIRRNRKWNGMGGFIVSQHQRQFFQKPAWPVQPPSAARDAQQAKFKTALQMWQALTNEEKLMYNKIATKMSRRGYDFFMTKTLKSL